MHKVWFLIIVILLTSCSNKAVYENIQIYNRQACSEGPVSEFEECFKRTFKTYEMYLQQRKADQLP